MATTITQVTGMAEARPEVTGPEHCLRMDSESRWELAAVEHKLLQLERQHAHLAHRLRVEVFLKEELQDRALGAEMLLRQERAEARLLQQRVDELQACQAAQSQQIAALQEDTAKSAAENQQLQVKLFEVKDEMKSKKEAADGMVCLLEGKLTAALKNIRILQQHISKQQGLLTFYQEQLYDSRTAEEIQSRCYHQVDEENKGLQKQVNELRVHMTQQNNKITSLQQDNAQLTAQNQQLLLELSELRIQVQHQQESQLCRMDGKDSSSSSSSGDSTADISSNEATKTESPPQGIEQPVIYEAPQQRQLHKVDAVEALQESLPAVNVSKPVSSSSSDTDPNSPITPDLSARNSAAVSDGDDGSTASVTTTAVEDTPVTAEPEQLTSSTSGSSSSGTSSKSSFKAKVGSKIEKCGVKVKAVVLGGMQRAASWCSRHLKEVNSKTETWYHRAVDNMRC